MFSGQAQRFTMTGATIYNAFETGAAFYDGRCTVLQCFCDTRTDLRWEVQLLTTVLRYVQRVSMTSATVYDDRCNDLRYLFETGATFYDDCDGGNVLR